MSILFKKDSIGSWIRDSEYYVLDFDYFWGVLWVVNLDYSVRFSFIFKVCFSFYDL